MQCIRIYILSTLFCFLAVICQAQTKVYRPKSKTVNADFNYLALDDLDGKTRPVEQLFNPVKGKFIVYKFLATFKGESVDDKIQDFNDILIIKTNKHHKIMDAYQYTLEWAEPPFCYDLYKSTAKNVMLTDKLSIELLKLVRTCYSDEKEKSELLKDEGIISLK